MSGKNKYESKSNMSQDVMIHVDSDVSVFVVGAIHMVIYIFYKLSNF